jgi:hypothetical protein
MNCLHIALLISSYLVFSVDAESSDTLRYQEKTKCKKFNAVYEVDQRKFIFTNFVRNTYKTNEWRI